MLLILTIIYATMFPLLVKARCLTDNSTSNHNELVHEIIQDFVKLLQTTESEIFGNSRNIRHIDMGNSYFCTTTNLPSLISAIENRQNATSMEIQRITSSFSEISSRPDAHLANVLSSMESMQNVTAKNIERVINGISNLLEITNTEILSAINSVDKILNTTSDTIQSMSTILKTGIVFEKIRNTTSANIETVASALSERLINHDNFNAVESVIGETASWQNDISHSLTSMLNQTMDMIINTERNNTQDYMNTIDILKYSKESQLKTVPEGFTEYNDRIVLLPEALGGTHSMTWYDSILRCLYNGAVPFIPRSLEDFRFTQRVNLETNGGGGIWLAASDHVTEGDFKWYDGTEAKTTLSTFDWNNSNGYAGDNNANVDCVNIWNSYDNKLEIENCTRASIWPMICEIL